MGMALKDDYDGDDIIAEINVTPLIDIMLVLLILFMVTSSVSLESGLDIELPKSSGVSSKKSNLATIVSLDKNGNISIQGEAVLKSEFVEKLKRVLDNNADKTVIFEGDTNATLGKTIEFMDLAKDAGAKSFAIATDSK